MTATAAATFTGGRRGRLGRLLGHAEGRFAVALLVLIVLLSLVAPHVLPYGPTQINPRDALQAPDLAHWFGTDELGRDQLSRVAAAAPIALYSAAASVGVALVAGTTIGLVAGYAGGPADLALSGVVEIMFSMPALLLALLVVGVLGPGLNNALLAVAIVYVPRFARIARGATLSTRQREFIEAARATGCSPARVVVEHVLPNILPSMIVQTALSLSTAEIAQASLSFLGLGVQPPHADWGNMLAASRSFVTVAPWLVIFPSLALVLIIIAFNLLGDALRDVLDPRLRTGRGEQAGMRPGTA
ncbi:MAG TPA: ABC transporter permease [bacterium]|nr:ABC transporter permease [bacterium]